MIYVRARFMSAFFAAAVTMVQPAYGIDPGCYPADVVRNATWLAQGAGKQYTIISGLHNVRRNPVFLTSNYDGSEGYSLEKEDSRICVSGKYTDIRTNLQSDRPSWAVFAEGSDTDLYVARLEHSEGAKIVYGSTAIVKLRGKEYKGVGVFFLEAAKPIEGLFSGSLFTNTKSGEGDGLLVLVSEKPLTNKNFYELANAQRSK